MDQICWKNLVAHHLQQSEIGNGSSQGQASNGTSQHHDKEAEAAQLLDNEAEAARQKFKQDQIAARESRGTWKHPLDFLFSCISVSVGLGSELGIVQK